MERLSLALDGIESSLSLTYYLAASSKALDWLDMSTRKRKHSDVPVLKDEEWDEEAENAIQGTRCHFALGTAHASR